MQKDFRLCDHWMPTHAINPELQLLQAIANKLRFKSTLQTQTQNDSVYSWVTLSAVTVLFYCFLHVLLLLSSLTSAEFLKQLHWLSIEWQIRFKEASLTFKALHTGHPPYLADLSQYYKPTRSIRSSASHLLSVPRHSLTFGSRVFRTSAPKIWISFPPRILQSQTLSSLRRHLKTHYCQSAYRAL